MLLLSRPGITLPLRRQWLAKKSGFGGNYLPFLQLFPKDLPLHPD